MKTDSTHEYYRRLKENESHINTHEARVSIETAKMLQQVGFDWECEYAILPTTEMGNTPYHYNQGKSHNYNNKVEYPFEIYSAPTLDVVQRWLREMKKMCIVVFPVENRFTFTIVKLGEKFNQDDHILEYHTYEEALEAGIQRYLTILLEEKK